ncbi:Rossmann-fold NAD(P)-binding domain-containing protein [Pseudomonas sp. S1_E04]
MNSPALKKKLLLVGAGNLCLQILKILGPKNAFEFVVLGRNEEATVRLCNLVALSCAQLGQYIAIKPVIADLTDIDKVTRLLRAEAPDMLVNCASLQSWRVITGLPKLSFEKLDQAQFGPWLPMHLTLMHNLMQAVKASGIVTRTVNAAFPDAVNPILARVGLAPDIGVGNVANLIPAVRFSIARLLECSPTDVRVQLYAQHYFSHYVPRGGLPPRASYRLLYEVHGRATTTRLPAEAIFSTVKSEFRRLGGVDGQFLTACSAVSVIEGLFSPVPVLVHAPGPLGLPGGYPVRLQEGKIEVQFSDACPKDEAVRINTICQSHDGIDEIHCDGSVTYNPQCMAVMQAMLGYSKKTMSVEQSAEFAHELARKYSSFKHSTW